ncbi:MULTISPECIES: CZB domain-containing protein [Hymenobacter]|uniref:Chemoreceptor zinc-binding domain-containing protein n=1 Tax=Hymenobacter mucosus TaxID=1411120 RepID=A0A238W2W0_9BACT|nr:MULTISPECIES: CZB domain-containing protein [Hymenobacter]SNR40741.1 Chemoreceptor zinc-binding domain-containing protein [Hymenobacter mucosus]
MNDELKQEFDSALVKHLHFKSKLRSFLYGSGTSEEPIRDPRACSFGRWILERALPDYRHLPETQQLDRVHLQIHQAANRLMDLHKRGQADAAIDGLAEVNQLADQVTRLLRTMEAKLRADL